MVEIEILESPDSNILSKYKYHKNQLYLGRNTGDLWIQDPDLYTSHVFLEVLDKDLLIHPQRGVEFYLINGKRASAVRKIKVNDTITIGKTMVKILSFAPTQWETKKNVLNGKLSKLVEENSQKLNVIESLTRLMKE